jgi:hypothetical protein
MHTLATDDRFETSMKVQPKGYVTVRDRYGKPFLVVMGERGVVASDYEDFHWKAIASAREELIKAGMPTYPTMERAAKAARKVFEYWRTRDARSQEPGSKR